MHPFWNFVVKVRRMHITLNISKFFATIQLMTDEWHFWHTWSLTIFFFLFVHSFYQHGWHQILLPLQDLCFLCWIFSCWPSLILTSLLLVCPHSFLSAHLHTMKMSNAPCGVIACLYNGTLHGLMCVCARPRTATYHHPYLLVRRLSLIKIFFCSQTEGSANILTFS